MATRFTVVLTINDPRSYSRLIALRQRLARERPDVHWVLWSLHETGSEDPDVRWFYADYTPPEGKSEELADQARRKFGFDIAEIYSSDKNWLQGLRSTDEMVHRAFWTLQQARKAFIDLDVRYVFLPSGGTMFGNAVKLLAENTTGVISYRMMPIRYLDMSPGTARAFFCRNNYCRLDDDAHIDRHDDRFQAALQHARCYVDAVREGRFRPDAAARERSAEHIVGTGGAAAAAFRILVARLTGHGRRRIVLDRSRLARWRSKRYLDRTRQPLPRERDYFLFCLHSPLDSQTTLRAAWFRDQIALIRTLACSLPSGVELWVKEHPVMPGMVPHSQLRYLRSHCPQVRILDYTHDFHDVIRDASGLITINSTAGLEAMVYGKCVICLGETFYRGQGLTHDIGYFKDLRPVLRDVLIDPRPPSTEAIVNVLAKLLYASEPKPGTMLPAEEGNRSLFTGITQRVCSSDVGATCEDKAE